VIEIAKLSFLLLRSKVDFENRPIAASLRIAQELIAWAELCVQNVPRARNG
jgi:hypothetical protein